MTKIVGLQLLIYSVLLACLAFLAYFLAPSHTSPTLIAGLAGGGLCLLWGVRIFRGNHSKILPLFTLAPVCYVLLTQTVITWVGGKETTFPYYAAATVITVCFLLSFAMLMRIAYAGVVFDDYPTRNKCD
jgi:Ni/Fe-hydrogenase subunit HybB-like protein